MTVIGIVALFLRKHVKSYLIKIIITEKSQIFNFFKAFLTEEGFERNKLRRICTEIESVIKKHLISKHFRLAPETRWTEKSFTVFSNSRYINIQKPEKFDWMYRFV